MEFIKCFAVFISLTLISIITQAQDRVVSKETISDSLKEDIHNSNRPSSQLFLHLDKTVYAPEETLWFKAYLLRDTSLSAKVLYLRIIDEEKILVIEEQFPIYDIRSHGSIILSKQFRTRATDAKPIGSVVESLFEGKYTLYAFTDHMITCGDTNVFVQHFEVKRTDRRLAAKASVTDTSQLKQNGKVGVVVSVSDGGLPADNIGGEYQLLAGNKEIKYGKLVTNSFGETYFNFTYPELGTDKSLKLKLLFMRQSDYVELTLNLSSFQQLKTVDKITSHAVSNKEYRLSLATDQQIYGNRKKVTVRLQAVDLHGNPVQANLSTAVVKGNRVDSSRVITILESYQNTRGSNRPSLYTSQCDPKVLSKVDGVIGHVVGMRFKEGTLSTFEPANRKIKNIDLRSFKGLEILDKTIKNSFDRLSIPVNQKTGTFFIPDSLLHTRKGHEWQLDIPYSENVVHRYQYLIEWQNPETSFDSIIIRSKQLKRPELFNSVALTKAVASTFDFKNQNSLREVVIGKQAKPLRRSLRQSNCERYHEMIEAEYNLSNRVTGINFVKEKTYAYTWNDIGIPATIMYLGCGRYKDIRYIRNITIPEIFPHINYDFNPSSENDNRSTLYWEPNLLTDAEGKVSFSFYTSDVTGEFEIVAQGLDINTFFPLMGKVIFKVNTQQDIPK